jgi:hypothetical protein
MALDLVIGRGLAFFVHPLKAWPRLTPRARACLVGAYAAAGYAVGIAVLLTVQGLP